MRTSRRGTAALSVAAVAAVSCYTGTVVRAALVPITLTPGSYNYNAVITGGTPGSSATFSGGTPGTVDTENGYTFYSSSYSSSGALPAAGVPFTSAANSSTSFVFQPYSGNNAMIINADSDYSGSASPPFFAPPYSQTGSLTLSSAGSYSNLAILYTMAGQDYNGDVPSIAYTLNFSDGTSYNNSGAAAITGTHNWTTGSASGVALRGGRVTTTGAHLTTGWTIYEGDIAIPLAYQTEQLSSISFFDSGSGSYASTQAHPPSGTDPNGLTIFGLSGTAVPEPMSGAMLAAAAAGALLRRRRSAAGWRF